MTETLRIKFTRRAVAAVTLPPGKNDQIAWNINLPTCGIRMRRGREGISKTYIVQPTRKPKIVIGDERKYTPEVAEKIARQILAQIALGGDPRGEKIKRKLVAPVLTLGDVADRYLAAKSWARRTREQNTFCLNEHWKPLRSRPVGAAQRVDVAARLQEISRDRGRKAARLARSVLSAMFRWGMGEGLCDHNPVIGTNDPAAGSKSRERVLDDSESKAVYVACPDDDFGRIVKLLQLTGLRRDEAGGLRWDEINFDASLLTIPATRSKNRRTLVLPLPEMVLNILRSIPRRDGVCIFGDPNNGFHSWSHHKKLLDARLAAAGTPLADWRLHDLRRTFRTGLGRLGVPPHVAELCINHVRKGMSAIYDRHTYQPEMASALMQWMEHLTAIVEGRKGKVVPLRA